MGRFLEKLMAAPEVKPLLSDEHFSVDGPLLQAWASHASLKRIDGQDDPPPPPSGPGVGFGAPKCCVSPRCSAKQLMEPLLRRSTAEG